MQQVRYHEIVIDYKEHKLISGDSKAGRVIKKGDAVAFEENVTEDYKELFLKNLNECSGNWFPTQLMAEEGEAFFYTKATRGEDADTIRLRFVGIDDLVKSQVMLAHGIKALTSQLDLYDDVFFGYDPATNNVEVFNTQEAYFDAGIYSIEEFEELLLNKASCDQISLVKSFIGHIKSKTGRFGVRIEGNLLNDDANMNITVLESSFVFFDKDSEGVVGHVHVDSSAGKQSTEGIKYDSLTGLVDKSDISRIAMERIDESHLAGTTLAVVDIDFFKNINDTYGHQYGDSVIRKIADIIAAEVGGNGIVGRFGGDEFLIVFYNITDEETLRGYLRNMKNMIKTAFPDKGFMENTPLSISAGVATYPKDAGNYEDTFMVADHCLYIAKDKGRNRYIIYNKDKHGTLESIRLKKNTAKKHNERDISRGDLVVRMFDCRLHGDGMSPEQIMDEYAEAFELQRISLFVGVPFKFRYSSGSEAIKDKDTARFLLGFLNSDFKDKYLRDQNFIVVNRIESLPVQASAIKVFLKENGILSYVVIRFFDKKQRECILFISSLGKKTQWNQMHYKFYRALGDLLSLYSFDN